MHVAICMLYAAAAMAQSDSLCQRLRTVLVPAGAGEEACTALEHRDFVQLDRLLAGLNPPTRAKRSEVLATQGAVAFLAGNMAVASRDFHQASALAALRDADAFTYAMALVNLNDEAQARMLLTGLSEKYPDRAIYVYWLGRLDYYQRRYEEAVQKLQRASQLDPRSARVWDSLGLAFDMQGRMDQALASFETAADLNRAQPNPSPWPPHDFGYLLLRMNRTKEAEAALRESIRFEPRLAQTHYHLGRVLEKEARDAEAIEEYRTAISDDTASSDACYSLAMLYRKLGRDAEASALFAEYRKRKESTSASIPEQNARP
jgi:tetratricopeptide (TPR) repeat protein